MNDDLKDNFAVARGMLDYLEDAVNSGSEDPARVRVALAKISGAIMEFRIPPRSSKKPERGYGYSFEEAQIVVSIQEHKSLAAAVRDYYPDAGPEWREAVAKRIRARRDDLTGVGETPDF